MNVRLDAIIPAHNEASTVGAVVSAVLVPPARSPVKLIAVSMA